VGVRIVARLANSVRVFAALVGNRDLLKVQAAFLGFNAAEYATWIAILLYAYEKTGPASVGVVALAQLIPAAVLAPVVASLGDRMRRDRSLLLGYVLYAVALGLVSWAMVADLEPLLVYAFACVAASALTLTRPAQGALLPALAASPRELTAANGFSAMAEGAGVLLGPLAAAAILTVSTPAAVFVASTGVLVLAALLAATVRVGPFEAASGRAERSSGSALEGFRILARDRDPRLLVGLMSLRMVAIGALDVLFVLMALELFDAGESGAGILNAALGAGGMVGGAVTLGLVGRRRLGSALVLGALSFGACLATIGLAPSRSVAPVLIGLAAVGLSLMDATGRTLLQRVVTDETLARVFGVLEGLTMAGLGLGSIAVPVLVAWLGLERTILALGVFLPVMALLAIPGLRRIDATVVVPERELALLGVVTMLCPLRPQVLESIARRSRWRDARAGTVLIAEGEPGDRFYVLSSGRLDVTRAGQHLAELWRPGEGFGEIALLYEVPRTATVTVVDDAELLVLERDDFLTAVTGHPQVARTARQIAEERRSR
jgi:MFS family permease